MRSEPTNTRINRVRVYAVTYQYRDQSGAPHEGEIRVKGGRTDAFELEYDPESPARARMKGESASVFGLGILLPLFFGLVGCGLFVWGLVQRLRERTLYRDGTSAQAQVTHVEPTNTRYNRQRVYRVQFIYQTPAGSLKASRSTVRLMPPISSVASSTVAVTPRRPST